MKELTCIICPRGCHLKIDDRLNVTGNSCPRGAMYAKSEMTNPTRTITTSVRVNNREDTLCSVKTNIAIPKKMIFQIMDEINKASVSAPTHIGDVVLANVLGTGADVIVTKNIL